MKPMEVKTEKQERDCPNCKAERSMARHNADWSCHECGYHYIDNSGYDSPSGITDASEAATGEKQDSDLPEPSSDSNPSRQNSLEEIADQADRDWHDDYQNHISIRCLVLSALTEACQSRDADAFPPRRLYDLVRYMRSELHQAGLVTDEEYANICQWGEGAASARRLEDYDTLRLRIQRLKEALEKDAVALKMVERYWQTKHQPHTEQRCLLDAIESNRAALSEENKKDLEKKEA